MKISVITINKNNAHGLKKTIESVINQSIKDYEYIIIDGNSNDGSIEVIKEYEEKISYWISENDNGIYNAMNKGLRKASGEYILMLNSGDFFVNDAVLINIYSELDGTDIIQGNTISYVNNSFVRNKGYGRSEISFLDVLKGHFLHQAAFCKLDLFNEFGYFDESYKYASDTIFFTKSLGFGGATFKYVNIDVANFDPSGFSSRNDKKVRTAYENEDIRVQKELFPGRLYGFCIESEKKIALYDELHKHKMIWKIVMLLKIISQHFSKEKNI